MAASESFKDLDVTPDELERLQKAMKDEKFRKLFVEYAEEISDPENRKKYEEEIAELERNRGMDVKFINPEPGFVIKTSVNGKEKAFVNFAQNQNVNQPKSQFTEQNGKSGHQWTIPHSLSPSREDFDKSGNKCLVFDCVFNPECFKIAENEPPFKQMIENTAFDAIEREFKVILDRNNCKQLKNMKYKGRATPTVSRTARSQAPGTPMKEDGVSALKLPYPYDNNRRIGTDINSNEESTSSKAGTGKKMPASSKGSAVVSDDGFTVPQYTIIHRGLLDLQQFTNAPDSRPSTRPQELVIKIALPLLKSASGIKLDVFEKRLYLESSTTASYKLDLPLPFPVDENNGSAKFDKNKSSMVVTLPVQPPKTPLLPSFAPSTGEKPLIEEIDQESLTKIPSENHTVNNIAASHPNSNENNNSDVPNVTAESVPSENGPVNTPKQALESDKEVEHVNTVESNKGVLSVGKYNRPEFSFHQKDDSVSIIIKVQSAIEVRSKLSHDGGECWLEIQTSGNGAFGLQLVFPEMVAVSHVTYDAGSQNVVFVLHKAEESQGEWQSFMAGADNKNLQLKKFITQGNVLGSLRDMTDQSWTEGSAKKELKSARVVDTSDGGEEVVIELQIGPKAEPLDEEGQGPTDVNAVEHNEAQPPFFPSPSVPNSSKEDSSGNVCQSTGEKAELSVGNRESYPPELVNRKSPFSVECIDSSQDQLPQGVGAASTDGPVASKPRIDLKSVEAQLSIGTDASESTSSSSITSPLSPHSLLKSSFKSPRQRSSKSVSFCDEVVVGTFTPALGKKGRKKSPYIRRSKTKLKAPSLEVCSDSEIFLSYQDTDDSEDDLWNIIPPRRALHRQSSSESESDVLGSPRGKSKKSKGSRQRKKERARRALMSESSTEECENEPMKEVDNVFEDGSRKQGAQPGIRTNGAKHVSSAEPPSAESTPVSSAGDGGEVDSSINSQQVIAALDDDTIEGEEGAGVGEDEEDGEWTTVPKKQQHKSERVAGINCGSSDQKGDEEGKVVMEGGHDGSTSVDGNGVDGEKVVGLGSEEDGSDWTRVTKKRHQKSHGEGSRSNQNHEEEVGDGVGSGGSASVNGGKGDVQETEALDKVDHHTKSLVNFSNEVMFDLDD